MLTHPFLDSFVLLSYRFSSFVLDNLMDAAAMLALMFVL
ncbi:hypothetical protein HC248_01012 [Polaromonas vacuolata]|uniref:Uncharacterized protein n=1 Tax=Polaromonas vacuolata TaxID=37448 RepID=A0A6H2H7C2_9BURK|nr:hypothetical protein HC248_01012 [Polaromonas vacuolata]